MTITTERSVVEHDGLAADIFGFDLADHSGVETVQLAAIRVNRLLLEHLASA